MSNDTLISNLLMTLKNAATLAQNEFNERWILRLPSTSFDLGELETETLRKLVSDLIAKKSSQELEAIIGRLVELERTIYQHKESIADDARRVTLGQLGSAEFKSRSQFHLEAIRRSNDAILAQLTVLTTDGSNTEFSHTIVINRLPGNPTSKPPRPPVDDS